MRLINTTTLELHEFHSAPEPYAILSHTWGDEEVSLGDMSFPGVTSRKGYKKIADTCRVAKDEGYRYAWVDTCCIDKSSSAELSEAINSMYRWYKSAAVCYAYLSDVPQRSFEDSRWFTRGWTLQELIAPRSLKFFDSEWTYTGSKCDLGLLQDISRITGIASEVLKGSALPSEFPIATRMSWAASRETTRVEDTAYCLLGIFDVHLPMIYGEGEMAFRRLQEEIIKRENDLTIFAWDSHTPTINHGLIGDETLSSNERRNGLVESTAVSLFARSPAQFEYGAVPFSDDFWEFSLSNRGLVSKIVIRVLIDQDTKLKVYGILLGAYPEKNKTCQMILRKLGPSLYCRWDKYPRTSPDTLGQRLIHSSTLTPSVPYHILVDSIASKRAPFLQFRRNAIHIPIRKEIKLWTATPSQLWDETDRLFLGPDTLDSYDVCLIARMEAVTPNKDIGFVVLVYFETARVKNEPVCRVALESEATADLHNRINREISLPFEELRLMMPDVSRWRDSVYVGVYEGAKKTTYEISVSVQKGLIRCHCAMTPIPVNELVIRVEKK